MNTLDVQILVATVDQLIFSHTGEHLGDLEQAILEGALEHQKYIEIAKKNHRSQKYVKDLAGKLWQTLSDALGEEVSKANIKSTLTRYYHANFSNGATDSRQNPGGNIHPNLPEKELKKSEIYQKVHLGFVKEMIEEGLSSEQIARILKLPLELVEQYLEKSK